MSSAATIIQKSPAFLRRANYVLNAEETDAVQAEERQLEEEIPRLDEGIQTCQDKLAFHRQQLEHYANLLEATQNRKNDACSALLRDRQLLSPSSMRALPNEVLSNIFLKFIEMRHSEGTSHWHRNSDSSGLWVDTGRIYIPHTALRLVCQRWNSVVVSEPHLWQTVLFLMPPSDTASHLDANKGLDDEYWGQLFRNVARAHTLPLDLQVKIACKKGPISPSIVHDTLCRLMDLLPRTTYLNMEFDSVTFGSRKEVAASTFPLPSSSDKFAVTNFVVGHPYSSEYKMLDRWILSLMAYMPMLHSVRLPSMHGSQHATGMFPSGTRYNALSTVQLRDASADILASLFKRACSLTSLRIHTICSTSPSRHPLRHETISELTVTTEKDTPNCLLQLAFPALKKLEIGPPNLGERRAHFNTFTLSWHQNSISQFYMQSRYFLTELSVHFRLKEPENIIPFLSSQPSLTSLTLRSAPSSLFSFLCVPKLLELAKLDVAFLFFLEGSREIDASISELMETLRNRRDIVERGDACQCLLWKVDFHLEACQLFGVEGRLGQDMRKLEGDFHAVGSRLALSTTECRNYSL
ncbi:hypothetical protein CYLTODRAFT_425041 [Cylindrobasidium torrendii FP15055 ss-10]|uniref:Uncharacterized protein n=1 Tax=Cylindrobasidium torrendii FP15055 ss-10 TaxID=1314674 RepID=A0A0D7B2A7_9AGAR|nr:hypothetical protein CYLTODRAFT_425041 [Cylindrobasidium torrendii FP15055 ss-10]